MNAKTLCVKLIEAQRVRDYSLPNRLVACAMMSEIRRAAAQKAFERIRLAGLPLEEDTRFLSWIEEWITGEIEMADVRQRYLDLLRERSAARKARHTPDLNGERELRQDYTSMSMAALVAEADRILDGFEFD